MYYYHFAVLNTLQSKYIVIGSNDDLGSIVPLEYVNDERVFDRRHMKDTRLACVHYNYQQFGQLDVFLSGDFGAGVPLLPHTERP
jgi:hypothetical protein